MASVPAPEPAAGWTELFRSGHGGALALICLGIWLHAGDELMVATVTPAMIADIGGDAWIGWLTALYEVGSITASALGAWLAHRLGVRATLALAGLVYMAGCIASGFAPGMNFMLAGRLLQGLGGGAIVAVSLISAWRTFPGRLLARAVAAVSLVWGVAAFVGPMVGAVFVEWGDWRGAFFFFAAQALLYAMAVGRYAPREDVAGNAPFPVFRMLVLSAGVIAVAWGGIVIDTGAALASVALGVGLIAVFVMLDARSGAARLLPGGVTMLASPAGSTMALVFGLSSGASALLIYGPVLIGVLHGLSAFSIGLILVLESVGWSIAALLVAGVGRETEAKLIVAGAAVVVIGMVGIGATIAFGPVWALPVFATLQGAGFGLSWTFILRRGAAIVAADDGERVTSAINTVQRFGYALGAAAIGIAANRAGLTIAMDAGTAQSVTIAIFALTLVPALAGLAAAIRFVRFEERDDAGASLHHDA